MNLLPRESTSLFNPFQDEFNQMLRSMRSRWGGLLDEDSNIVTSDWAPAVDIVEDDDHFVIRADIPGVDAKDISVSMENGMLSIQGERKSEKKEKKNGYLRTECSRGMFYRRFSLPDSADADKIDAKSKDGVLTISIAKRKGAQPKAIKIQS